MTRTTEGGDRRITEDGDARHIEASLVGQASSFDLSLDTAGWVDWTTSLPGGGNVLTVVNDQAFNGTQSLKNPGFPGDGYQILAAFQSRPVLLDSADPVVVSFAFWVPEELFDNLLGPSVTTANFYAALLYGDVVSGDRVFIIPEAPDLAAVLSPGWNTLAGLVTPDTFNGLYATVEIQISVENEASNEITSFDDGFRLDAVTISAPPPPTDIDPTGTSTSIGAAVLEAEVNLDVTGESATAGTTRVGPIFTPPVTARDTPLMTVEAALSQAWSTPVDELVWTRIDGVCCVRSVAVEEGTRARVEEVEPGICTIIFDNRSGALDPSNTTSPWWDNGPGVDKDTRIRVTVFEDADDVTGSVLFVGSVDRMTPSWNLGMAEMEIELVDALADLAQTPLESALVETMRANTTVKHVWPFSAPGSIIEDIVGDADGAWSLPVRTQQSMLPFEPRECTRFGGEDVTASIPVTVDAARWVLHAWVSIDSWRSDTSGSVSGAPVLVSIAGAGGDAIEVLATPGQFAQIYGRCVESSAQTDLGTVPGVSNVGDGQPHLITIARTGTTTYTVTMDANAAGTETFTTADALVLDEIIVAQDRTLDMYEAALIQSMILASNTSTTGLPTAAEIYALGLEPWATDDTAERFTRICTNAGLDSVVSGTGWPECSPADTGTDTALDHIVKGANGDGATVTVDLTADGIPLYRQTDPETVVAWFDTRGQIGAPVVDASVAYGIDRLATTVKVKRGTGEIHTAVDATTKYRTSTVLELDTTLGDPADARARADALLLDRRIPRTLIPELRIQARDARVPWASCLLRPGDHVGVVAHPPGRPDLIQIARIERVTHFIDYVNKRWDLVYGLDRVTQFLDWDEVVDTWADWDELLGDNATWWALLEAGAPNPPTV
jgi:hypothetical protein